MLSLKTWLPNYDYKFSRIKTRRAGLQARPSLLKSLQMLAQVLVFLGTETGRKVVSWIIGVGLPLVILAAWVFSLNEKQSQLETKVDDLNTEVKQTLKFQTDTLYRTLNETKQLLDRNNRFLEQFEPIEENGKRQNFKRSGGTSQRLL